jgi:soluble lytic murein transglycosylase
MPLRKVSRSNPSQRDDRSVRASTVSKVPRNRMGGSARWRKQIFWLALALGTLLTLVLFKGVARLPLGNWLQPPAQVSPTLDLNPAADSSVLPLVKLPEAERTEPLQLIADGSMTATTLDRSRARYLLALDHIQADHGGQALPYLDGLDQDYAVLAPHILAKRAQAQSATGDTSGAKKTWNALLKRYPKSPVAAEALYQLGQREAEYWDRALTEFPSHPRSLEIAQTRLEKDPKQLPLLMLLAKHGIHLEGVVPVLNRIKKEYASQLKPEDWETLGFAYWENAYYGSAGAAYAQAPPSALNLYRAARGAQLGERLQDAEQGYRNLVQAFPNEPETGLALLRLADLAERPEDAISFLDQVVAQFPDKAAEALLAKSKILQKRNSPDTALQLRQKILKEYSASDTAAEIRWEQAELLDKQGDLDGAWSWAKQIVEQSPDSEIAPRAAFWIGKWAAKLDHQPQSREAFQYAVSRYPDSYYAWRAASLLGWDVGDFSTVRQKQPQVARLYQQSTLPAGSEALRELYLLGQNQDAWALWQSEFTNRLKPTVAEQFTDGLLRLGVNDNLDGIFMLSSLAWREPAEEQAQYKTLRQELSYWQALYPFPFMETIEKWSQQRQLNPMLVTALIRQESRFEPKIGSSAGAVGLMQVIPETADWVANQISLKDYNLQEPEDNVNLGTWYLDFTHREYQNNSVFAIASYNAGPAKVAEWIQKYDTEDLDRFVEIIPYPETRGYVESVLGNYWNYLRLYNPDISQQLAIASPEHAAIARSEE